jgi:hypothetical protein
VESVVNRFSVNGRFLFGVRYKVLELSGQSLIVAAKLIENGVLFVGSAGGVTSRRVTSRRVTSRRVTSRRVTSGRVTGGRVTGTKIGRYPCGIIGILPQQTAFPII